MIFITSYKIENWSEWNDKIYSSAINFADINDVMPNIIIMNRHSYSQINYMIKVMPQQIHYLEKYNFEDKKWELEERLVTAPISKYECDSFTLTFAFSEDVADNNFELMYDNHPFWLEEDDDDDLKSSTMVPSPSPVYAEIDESFYKFIQKEQRRVR